MPEFEVGRREVHVQYLTIEADTPEAAIAAICEGEGDETFFEYSHTLDCETWSAELRENNLSS